MRSGAAAETEAKAAVISALTAQREALGLSQRDLAALCGMPQSTVARIESGKTNPTLGTLLLIMGKLGLALTVMPMQAQENQGGGDSQPDERENISFFGRIS